MVTGDIKSKIDRIWLTFWSGDIPFTDFHDNGVEGVFNHDEATNIVNIIDKING